MYTKHFFKMLIGLVLMAVIGLAGLVIANHYSKNQQPVVPSNPTVPQ